MRPPAQNIARRPAEAIRTRAGRARFLNLVEILADELRNRALLLGKHVQEHLDAVGRSGRPRTGAGQGRPSATDSKSAANANFTAASKRRWPSSVIR